MSAFEQAFAIVVSTEGGYVNNPSVTLLKGHSDSIV